jgi:methionyl aminopeptidase
MAALIKKPEDIELLRESGRRLAGVLDALAKAVNPGISTLELDALAYKLITDAGDKPAFLHYKPQGAIRPFPNTLCISVNDEVVHGIPRADHILKEGDTVGLDLGLSHLGMFTDSAIRVAVGEISKEDRRLLEATKEALHLGIKAARGGNRIGDIGSAISFSIAKAGYSLVEELGGHGLGYKAHEPPEVPNIGTAGTGRKLEPGMILAIEPIVNAGKADIIIDSDKWTIRTQDGSRSCQFEHTILITEGDAEILTKI